MFEHLGERFTPADKVDPDHPMIAARPDLFTPKKPTKPTADAPVSNETNKE
jgi:hypothetical protein